MLRYLNCWNMLYNMCIKHQYFEFSKYLICKIFHFIASLKFWQLLYEILEWTSFCTQLSNFPQIVLQLLNLNMVLPILYSVLLLPMLTLLWQQTFCFFTCRWPLALGLVSFPLTLFSRAVCEKNVLKFHIIWFIQSFHIICRDMIGVKGKPNSFTNR